MFSKIQTTENINEGGRPDLGLIVEVGIPFLIHLYNMSYVEYSILN